MIKLRETIIIKRATVLTKPISVTINVFLSQKKSHFTLNHKNKRKTEIVNWFLEIL